MPYVIDFQIKGLQLAVAQINQARAAMQQLNAANQASKGSGGSSGGSGGGSAAKPAQTAQQAYAAALRQQAQLNRAQAQAINSQIALNNALKRANGQNQSPFMKQLATAIFSTRVGFGPNGISVMPLVGQLFKLLGNLGPVGEAAAVAIAVLTAQIMFLAAAARTAIEHGTDFGRAYFSGGGTFKETQQLAGIGAATGYSASDMAGMARAYNESVKNNPVALNRAASHGYSPNYSGIYGDTDDTKRFLNALNDMLDNPNKAQARLAARGTPLENFGNLTYASKDVQNQVKGYQSFVNSPEQLQKAADAQYKLNMTMAEFSRLMTSIGNSILPFVNANLLIFQSGLKVLQGLFDELQIGIYNLMKWIHDKLGIGPNPDRPKDAYDDLARLKGEQQAKHAEAMDRQTQAIENNTRALNEHRQVFGGGPNGNAAIPEQYWNPKNSRYTQAQIHLGQLPI